MRASLGETIRNLHKNPAVIQISILFLVVVVAFFGGFVFMSTERSAQAAKIVKTKQRLEMCLEKYMNSTGTLDEKVNSFFSQCVEPDYKTETWTYLNSVLYAFTVMTTGGYRRFVPATTTGRLFSIIYALMGIPLAMLVIANIGAFLKEAICKFLAWRRRRKRSAQGEAEEYNDDLPVEITGSIMFAWFLLYVFVGAVLTMLIDTNRNFVSAVFLAFSSLTGGDMSHLGSGRIFFLPLKVVYTSLGLAIATVAIDVGSNYMKKLHYFGRKIQNVTQVKIWFGGKKVSVKSLLKALSVKYGIDMEVINSLNLEQLVEQAIEEQETGHLRKISKCMMNGTARGPFTLSSAESFEVAYADDSDF